MQNDIITIGSESWRVLQKIDSCCLAIKLNTEKMNVCMFNIYDLEDMLLSNKIHLAEDNKSKLKQIDSLMGKDAEVYKRVREFIEYLCDYCECNWSWLLDCHYKVKLINDLSKKFSMSEVTVRRYIRKYLQGGMKIQVLASDFSNCGAKGKQRKFCNRKVGKQGISMISRSDEVIEVFEKMSKRYLQNKARIPYTKLYEDMIAEYYSTQKVINGSVVTVPYSAIKRPTYRQFVYWLKRNMDITQCLNARWGKKEVANNYRPLFSDSIAHLNVKSIGDRYEMDEMETDFYLVSRAKRNKVIGRAILYLIIDVYSRCIVGCGVGLDNNSWSGAEMALLNMAENKVEFCAKYGITISKNEWPIEGVLPQSIMMDNGAEYLSEQFPDLVSELGISMAYAPTRMGSYKPNVEQKFKQMNCHLKERLPGQIIKDEYGQAHINGARLDIDQFTQCVIRFILNYNNSPMDNYPDTKEMYEEGLVLTPQNIWNYSLEKNNELIKIDDLNLYKYSLLSKGTATMTRSGIEFEKMYYVCSDMEWLVKETIEVACNGIRKKKLTIRYDKRNLNYIYYEKGGNIHVAWLNSSYNNDMKNSNERIAVGFKTSNQKYTNMTFFEVEEINDTKKIQRQENKESKIANNINTNIQIQEIVKEAKKRHCGRNEKHDISTNRNEEKQKLHDERFIEIVTVDYDKEKINIESKEVTPVISISQESIEKMSRMEKLKWLRKLEYSNNQG